VASLLSGVITRGEFPASFDGAAVEMIVMPMRHQRDVDSEATPGTQYGGRYDASVRQAQWRGAIDHTDRQVFSPEVRSALGG
jgi:hypothetical protein